MAMIQTKNNIFVSNLNYVECPNEYVFIHIPSDPHPVKELKIREHIPYKRLNNFLLGCFVFVKINEYRYLAWLHVYAFECLDIPSLAYHKDDKRIEWGESDQQNISKMKHPGRNIQWVKWSWFL